jgi:hypothetical protein
MLLNILLNVDKIAGVEDVGPGRKVAICRFKGWTSATFFATNKTIFKATAENFAYKV